MNPSAFSSLLLRRIPWRSLLSTLLLTGVASHSAYAQGTGYFHTSGNQILDANGQIVRIAGINWYGFETVRGVPGGLTTQDYKSVLQTIKTQGYNTVRIPLSNQMVETPQVPSAIGYSNGINSDLNGLNSMQILDKVVTAAGNVGLKVILDNHRSEAGDSAEQNGLWYTGAYPEQNWINDWTALASRYNGNTTVIGFDLRNEPHNATSGGACWDCGGANDWHLAAQRGGNAVLAVNPKLLIFVEGTDVYNNDWYWWGGNLEGVMNSPVRLNVQNQLVYSAHDYGPVEYQDPWFNGSTTYSSLSTVWSNHWAFISKSGIAPVWIGEFGTTNNGSDIQNNAAGSQGQWFQSLVQYLSSDATLNWTYWALNGEDHYGLLNANYDSTPANSTKQQLLASIQSSMSGASGTGTGGFTGGGSQFPYGGSNLTANAVSSSQINLQWQASPSAGVTYTIYRGPTNGFVLADSNRIASGVAGLNYADTGLPSSTTYWYAVVSNRNGVPGDSTNQAGATTGAPSTTGSGSGGTTTPPSSGTAACHVSYSNQSDWGNGFTGAITVTNTGTTTLSTWTLTWAYSGNQQVTQAWSALYSQSGQTVTLTNAGWNGTMAPGASQTGIGFNATYTGWNPAPATFYLNGVVCR